MNEKLNDEELKQCINNECLFTMDEIKDMPKKKLVMISKTNDKYYCFDVTLLKKLLFIPNNDEYLNPYTRQKISPEDLNKILNADIKMINYFCD